MLSPPWQGAQATAPRPTHEPPGEKTAPPEAEALELSRGTSSGA